MTVKEITNHLFTQLKPFDQTYRMYKQLDNFEQYKDHILKR